MIHSDDRTARAPMRRAAGRSLGKWTAILGAAALVLTVGLPRVVGGLVGGLFDGMGEVFDERPVDRSGPVLLEAITDLADYDAAAANLEVLVDLERDTRYVPSAIKGRRTMYMAHGAARAGVSFRGLTAERVVVDPVTGAVTITLPHARITGVSLDVTRSKVVEQRRGLLDRIGSVVGDGDGVDGELMALAQDRLRTAPPRATSSAAPS